MIATSGLAIGIAAVVIVVTIIALLVVFRRPAKRETEDSYSRALELWLTGDKAGAAELLRRVVGEAPQTVDPYLQLGILLRELGDPGRAAVLHRSLTVRADLTREKRITVGLALAEDLAALNRWDEVQTVLDELTPLAGHLPRFLWLRFAERYGRGDLPEAARTLQRAARHGPREESAEFERAYAVFQLDRALEHARRGEVGEAQARLKDVAKIPAAQPRSAFIRALLAAGQGDAAAAVQAVSEGILAGPDELALVWPALEQVLLDTGQYERIVPILESACAAAAAPPRLWIALALLYEKLGQRDRAVRLLTGKRGDSRLTPDAAAPYLRFLVADAMSEDLQEVWRSLTMPEARERSRRWACSVCGRVDEEMRWFCPGCRSFVDYVPRESPETLPVTETAPAGPVRF